MPRTHDPAALAEMLRPLALFARRAGSASLRLQDDRTGRGRPHPALDIPLPPAASYEMILAVRRFDSDRGKVLSARLRAVSQSDWPEVEARWREAFSLLRNSGTSGWFVFPVLSFEHSIWPVLRFCADEGSASAHERLENDLAELPGPLQSALDAVLAARR